MKYIRAQCFFVEPDLGDINTGCVQIFVDILSEWVSTRVVQDLHQLTEAPERRSGVVTETVLSQIRGVQRVQCFLNLKITWLWLRVFERLESCVVKE